MEGAGEGEWLNVPMAPGQVLRHSLQEPEHRQIRWNGAIFQDTKSLTCLCGKQIRHASGEPPAMLSACSDRATIENTSCDCDEELCDTES